MKMNPAAAQMVMQNARQRMKDPTTGRFGRSLKRGTPMRRVIAERVIAGYEIGYHATKGWRAKAVTA